MRVPSKQNFSHHLYFFITTFYFDWLMSHCCLFSICFAIITSWFRGKEHSIEYTLAEIQCIKKIFTYIRHGKLSGATYIDFIYHYTFLEITKFSKILSKLTFFLEIFKKFVKFRRYIRNKCKFWKYFRKFCNFKKRVNGRWSHY